jgi:hypothetical protein
MQTILGAGGAISGSLIQELVKKGDPVVSKYSNLPTLFAFCSRLGKGNSGWRIEAGIGRLKLATAM